MKSSVSKSPSEQAALLETLRSEFARLNAAYFDSSLTLPEIAISTRKTYGGYYQPSRHRIVISWQAYQEHGLEETLNTFRHEVAHIVHPDHSAAFWRLAYILGVTQRYAKAPLHSPTRNYVYACPGCGKRYVRRKRLRAASCAACDKRYNPRYALRLIPSEVSHSGRSGTVGKDQPGNGRSH